MYVVELKQLNAAGSLWCLVSLLTPAWMFSGVAFFIRPYGPRKWRDPESNLSLKVFNIFCATSGMMVPMDSQNLPDQPVTRVCGWVWIMRYHQLSSIRTIIPWTISFVSPENGRFHTTLWLCCLSQSRMFFGWYPIFSRLLATFPRFLCLWPISPIVGECSVVVSLISFGWSLFMPTFFLPSGYWRVRHGIDGPNRNRWFTELKNGGSFPWQTVSHNQMVSFWRPPASRGKWPIYRWFTELMVDLSMANC